MHTYILTSEPDKYALRLEFPACIHTYMHTYILTNEPDKYALRIDPMDDDDQQSDCMYVCMYVYVCAYIHVR
jgi:hypothetical protein